MKTVKFSAKYPVCNAVISNSSINNDIANCESMFTDCTTIFMTNIVVKDLTTSEAFQLFMNCSFLINNFAITKKKGFGKKMMCSKVSLEFLLSNIKVTKL